MKDIREKHYTIAIATGNTQSDYSIKLMEGFYAAAKDADVNLVLLTEQELPPYCLDIITDTNAVTYRYQFHSIYEYTHFIKPDAAIITYGSISSFTAKDQKRDFLSLFAGIPYLMLEDDALDENVPYLSTDNYNGMKKCIEHLIVDHGYRKIAFLSGPEGNHDAQERLQAYLDTMKQYNLPIADTMIAYGNYTDCVDEQATALLSNNPGLEAIVCSNDAMAKSCYHVCTMHNLIVGKDIAITGFDDISSACSMSPPLTSVSQNIFHLGYTALMTAVSMCKGNVTALPKIHATLKKRCSCGCSPVSLFDTSDTPVKDMSACIKTALTNMTNLLLSSVFTEQNRAYLADSLSDYFFYIYDTVFLDKPGNFNMEYMLIILKKIALFPYISNSLLLENIIQMLHFLQDNAKTEYSGELISSIIATSQQFIHSLDIEKLENRIMLSQRKAWFVPTFTKNLVNDAYMHRLKIVFQRVMTEMQKMNIRSAYFFLFDSPIIHAPNEPLVFPEYINLTAYFNSKEMKAYDMDDRLKFTSQDGLMSFIQTDVSVNFTAVILFSGQKQYGVLICDIDHADIDFLQICSLQIGTLLHFIELNQLEHDAQEKLQNSLQIIEEKNKMLSFFSEYDELTKLLNRRGFIERAPVLCQNNIGKTAYLVFGDLDHLKEINDVFGHVEGDFAIKTIAERFQSVLPQDAVCGRIGGDEFVSLLVTDEADFSGRIKNEFHAAFEKFNANSKKPYYVEMSIGIFEFICSEQTNLEYLIKQSDQLLYQDKATRRKSIQKK